MNWFGKIKAYPAEEIPVPVGEACLHCAEPFRAEDSGMQYPDGGCAHANCHLRQILGSVAHLEKRCSCYVVGSAEGDPEGMTPRQAADAAVETWNRRRLPPMKVNDGSKHE